MMDLFFIASRDDELNEHLYKFFFFFFFDCFNRKMSRERKWKEVKLAVNVGKITFVGLLYALKKDEKRCL